PTAAITGAPASSPEGTAIALGATATEPSAVDAAALTRSWSVTKDGAAFASGAGTSFGFTPSDNGAYAVTLTVADKDGGTGSASATIAVTNVAPSALTRNLSWTSIGEGDTVTLSGHFVDPGAADTHTLVIDWGDGSPTATLTLAAGVLTYSATHQYLDDNPTGTFSDGGAVTVTATDKDGGAVSGAVAMTLFNEPPVVGTITAPTAPVRVNTPITASASFTDHGVLDTHTATITWGDGGGSAATVVEANGAGTASGSHVYTAPGLYTIKITITDDDTGFGTSTFNYLVVYDPYAGYVSGSGTIASPAEAYRPSPTVAGDATFTFNAQYPNGATVPTGSTQFALAAAGFQFNSTSYDWLVVSGAKAQYTGSGTVNGAGDYGFLLSAIDGHATGGGGVDKLRMKIWNKATGALVYDNQRGAADAANPTTAISTGTIDLVSTGGSPDTVPPTISAVRASAVSTTSATITWTTNEASDTQVEYGTTTAYGYLTTLNSAMATSHSQGLTGLAPSTLYHYRVRSKDAAGNPATSANFTFTTAALASCPCSIWSSAATPAVANDADATAIEVGVKFRTNQPGYITGIRFYKGRPNTGTHTAHLWSKTGTLLASATFTAETGSGWQQVSFATPVAINPYTTYVASYHAPNGQYAFTDAYFGTGVTNGPLTALANGTDGANGVFRYTTTGGFPSQTYNASNYWVDVVFTTSAP
ncbi:MAG TPA: DUF4082 domain-containing protein, partial [Chloroflexota bacterium]|nr:DUF4082 domain-containing protein [Chloroflexota bacterium]